MSSSSQLSSKLLQQPKTINIRQIPLSQMESIISQHKPHFYEYMEIQLLQSYISKGINYFVNSILNSSPKLINLRYYSEEISFLIGFLKDFWCLKNYSSTYAEQFYGLQRVDLRANSNNKGSKNLKILYHTLIMTLVPYLLNKLQTLHNSLVQQQANQGKTLNLAQKIFTKIYPYLYMLISAIQVLMKFRYLLQKQVKVFDLYYKASNTQLGYKMEKMQQKMNGEKVHYPWMDLVKTPGLLAIVIGHKVLGWYFGQRASRKVEERKGNNIDRYASPLGMGMNRVVNKQKKQAKEYTKGQCLICGKSITNPTVIKQNGHVFCYICISEYVNMNRKCPITGIPITQQNLQMIYS